MKNKLIPKIAVNFITFTRLLGALLLPFIFSKTNFTLVAIITLIIFLTDIIDGFLARAFKCYTFFGAILDVISDKLLNFVIFIILGLINPIMFISLILELLIILVNIFKYKEGFNVKVRLSGKIKTVVLSIVIILLFGITAFNKDNLIVTVALVILLIGSQIFTLIDYIVDTIRHPEIMEKVKKGKRLKTISEIIKIFFDSEFYLLNKDKPLKVLLYR